MIIHPEGKRSLLRKERLSGCLLFCQKLRKYDILIQIVPMSTLAGIGSYPLPWVQRRSCSITISTNWKYNHEKSFYYAQARIIAL